jgi:putative methionine-R-sulfoxide reductase with GAF domain/HPt (histidine-containing phosphotransfer) domain-containing protein
MFQLSFNQKVGLGFAFIIVLLVTSGATSLWNLSDINESTSRVNQTAVPVVKESNNVQIQLLKLAKLSALAFNAESKEQISEYKRDFDAGIERFDQLYLSLEALAESDAEMTTFVIGIKSNYDFYRYAVAEMFDAKIAVLNARDAMLSEADTLLDLADGVGGALVEIQYFAAPAEYEEQMELVSGMANQADTNAMAIMKTIEEIKITSDQSRLSSGMDDFKFALDDSKRWYDKAAEIFKEFDDQSIIAMAETAYADLDAYFSVSPSMVDHKLTELKKIDVAKQKLSEADAAVSQSISGLDELLGTADAQFEVLQHEVLGNLDLGFKTSIAMLIILILLAAQNFNSMRLAIRKKMEDLAKLNKIGGTLAGAQTQNIALEEVLQSMHDKIGVSQGSVFLTNESNELELRAHFPPKTVSASNKPTRFNLGEGIIGKAAKTKQVIFVPNTERDKTFVANDNEDAAKALLCVPLVDKDMLVGVINLSGDVKSVHFADSDYEFVSSVARSLVTTIKNIRLREVIEEHNRNLEAKVEERTSELRQKNQDIANMMANMHQGLFTIVGGGLVHKEYAAYLEEIFETDRIAGRNVSDLLFANSMLGSDAIDQAITAVDAIVGEDAMMFDFNSHCLVKEMTLSLEGGREKILEMDWDPIVNEADEVERLMVTVRDVTELRELEAAAEGQKKELEIIGEILAVEAGKFAEFLRTSKQFIAACRQAISNNPSKEQDVIAELFRNMHTVKGNARTYGLSYITNVVHEVESVYDSLRNDSGRPWNQAELLADLDLAEETLGQYDYVFRDKLGRDGEVNKGLTLDPERIASWLDSIKQLTRNDMNDSVKHVVSEAYNLLVFADAAPLSDVIEDVLTSANSIAGQLQKPKPVIEIDNGEVFIDGRIHSMMNNIFMHVIRNAMDHGIEQVEERLENGKTAQGQIRIATQIEDGFATFTVQDDGRGIAIERIRTMAIEKGLLSDHSASAAEVANLIFASGFTTAETLTDVSGRGVGMDAVKGFLEQEGGKIEIALHNGAEDASFRNFETQISIPSRFFTQGLSFAKTA